MPQAVRNLMLALLPLLVQPAIARDAPLENPSDIPVAWSAAGWQCRPVEPGKIRAVLLVRQHMAESLITFDTEKYSVTYVDSRELRYDPEKNEIHRKHNLWVANLIGDINKSIASIR
jgi:hypothetical protein